VPMPESVVEDYLLTVREDARQVVRALAAAVDATGEPFDCKITYGMLVYTFDQHWHRWVVAIGVSAKVVNLRFLYGQRLTDASGRLRPGSTTAATVDYRSVEEVDRAEVIDLIRQAVAIHPR